jgi:putative tricarboxylic transport membrane protein
MKRYDRVMSLIWIVVGGSECLEAWKLGLGTVREPGTGFVPFLSGMFLIILSLLLFGESSIAVKKNPDERIPIWSVVNWNKALYIIILLFAYIVLIRKLGFLVDTFLLVTLLIKREEGTKWVGTIIVGLFVAVISYVVFKLWLYVPFPEGPLGF